MREHTRCTIFFIDKTTKKFYCDRGSQDNDFFITFPEFTYENESELKFKLCQFCLQKDFSLIDHTLIDLFPYVDELNDEMEEPQTMIIAAIEAPKVAMKDFITRAKLLEEENIDEDYIFMLGLIR